MARRKGKGSVNKGDKALKKKNFKNHILSGGKSKSVSVKNLPFSVKEKHLRNYFQKFGVISEVKLMQKKNGKLTGNAFVHFGNEDAAEAAIEKCSGTDFMGRVIKIEWARPLPGNEDTVSKVKEEKNEKRGSNFQIAREKAGYDNVSIKSEDEYEEEEKSHIDSYQNHYKETKKVSFSPNSIMSRKDRRGRIIVRNLSFKTTEDKLMNHFKEFGDISEVKVLKKDDGKLVGCGFVQFVKKQSAIRAILGKSGKPFLGRPIVCDWALPKGEYLKQVSSEKKREREEDTEEKIKEEPGSHESDNEVEIKEEPRSDESDSEVEIKEKPRSDESDSEVETKEVELDSDEEPLGEEEEEDEEEEDEDEEEYDEMEESDETDDEMEDEEDRKPSFLKKKGNSENSPRENKRPKVISNDVSEGCTIFIKNIPFTATNEDLEKCMTQFGPFHYALICMDKLTEHSKGTGFVKFKSKESTEACLQASELTIRDKNIEVMKALPRDDIKNLNEIKKEKKFKDKRHLYLVKEGVILAGSPAAKDVSVADMDKRLKLERWKTQMLRNLNMFVSNTRLIIYNVPPTWTDSQVRHLFKENTGRGAVIKEARIMRDMRNVDAQGVGKSKEYAFVHFTKHEDAIQALRNINNNPSIFSNGKRPIVTFSIENKVIHKIKQRRLQKSQIANKERQNNRPYVDIKPKKNGKNSKVLDYKAEAEAEAETEVEQNRFSGVQGKPGNKNMRSNFKMRNQAATHFQNVKQNKRKQKLQKQLDSRRKKHKEPQPKKKMKVEGDSFTKLVDKYRSKLMSADSQKRWYE